MVTMSAAIFLLCLVATVVSASENIVNDFDPSKPEPLCRVDGQFLLHGQNRCKFLRCTYGTEPWKDEEGNTRFYAIERMCPYGTAVSRAAYTNEHNSDPKEGRQLCTDRVAPHQGGIRYYDPCSVEIPHYPAYKTHPTHYTTKQSKYTDTETNPHTNEYPPSDSHTNEYPPFDTHPAYNPYASHAPSFHYKVRQGDSKSLFQRHPNEPTDNTYPSSYGYAHHYGHPGAHYPSYPSSYIHHPYPAYISYPAKEQEEETEDVEQAYRVQEDPAAENQVEEPPAEEAEIKEVEEVIAQEEAKEETAPEEAPEAPEADEAAADPLGEQEVMETGAYSEEEGPAYGIEQLQSNA